LKFLLSVVFGSLLLCQSILGNRREQDDELVSKGEKSRQEKKYRVRIVNPKQIKNPQLQELTGQNEDGIPNFEQKPLVANSPYTKKFQS
jgi:hypothetical protein